MIPLCLDEVRPEDLEFIGLKEPDEPVNEDGIVNEPIVIDTRTGKPYQFGRRRQDDVH